MTETAIDTTRFLLVGDWPRVVVIIVAIFCITSLLLAKLDGGK